MASHAKASMKQGVQLKLDRWLNSKHKFWWHRDTHRVAKEINSSRYNDYHNNYQVAVAIYAMKCSQKFVNLLFDHVILFLACQEKLITYTISEVRT